MVAHGSMTSLNRFPFPNLFVRFSDYFSNLESRGLERRDGDRLLTFYLETFPILSSRDLVPVVYSTPTLTLWFFFSSPIDLAYVYLWLWRGGVKGGVGTRNWVNLGLIRDEIRFLTSKKKLLWRVGFWIFMTVVLKGVVTWGLSSRVSPRVSVVGEVWESGRKVRGWVNVRLLVIGL